MTEFENIKQRAINAGYEVKERTIKDRNELEELTIFIDYETKCYVLSDGWFGAFRNGHPVWGNGQRANVDEEVANKLYPIIFNKKRA